MRKPKLFSLVSTTNVIYIYIYIFFFFFNLKVVAPVRLDENDGFFYFCLQWPKSPKCATAVNGHL